MSIFLKNNSQLPSGRFVLPVGGPLPYTGEAPGAIRLFNDSLRYNNVSSCPSSLPHLKVPKQGRFLHGRVLHWGTLLRTRRRSRLFRRAWRQSHKVGLQHVRSFWPGSMPVASNLCPPAAVLLSRVRYGADTAESSITETASKVRVEPFMLG